MNSWKLNSIAAYHFKKAVTDSWEIPFTMVYKEVSQIDSEGYILRKNGKVYKLTLIEVTDTENKNES
jgi:hypothetical protein